MFSIVISFAERTFKFLYQMFFFFFTPFNYVVAIKFVKRNHAKLAFPANICMFADFDFTVFWMLNILFVNSDSSTGCSCDFANLVLSRPPAHDTIYQVFDSTCPVGVYFKLLVSDFEDDSFLKLWTGSTSLLFLTFLTVCKLLLQKFDYQIMLFRFLGRLYFYYAEIWKNIEWIFFHMF